MISQREPPLSDFFETHTGNAAPLRRRNRWKYRLRDWMFDLPFKLRAAELEALKRPHRDRSKVLIVGVVVPSRSQDIGRVVDKLGAGSRHDISVSTVPMGNQGKFQNIDAAIRAAAMPLRSHDWLVITDDDISFAPGFLDDLIDWATLAGLDIAQPAHAFESYTTYAITKRRRGSLVRETQFVEIGPLTLLRARTFDDLIPFPDSRWCYGIDVLWSEIAEHKGYRMGVVDATPLRHLRPVAGSYNMDAAIEEGRQLLTRFRVKRTRAELFARDQVVVAMP